MPMIANPAVAVLAMLGLLPPFVSAAATEAVTLSGTVACAKCTLKRADAKECQNVLRVAGAGDSVAEYYIGPTEAAEKFGEVCTETPRVSVTGAVSEKDGRKWIAPTRMERDRD